MKIKKYQVLHDEIIRLLYKSIYIPTLYHECDCNLIPQKYRSPDFSTTNGVTDPDKSFGSLSTRPYFSIIKKLLKFDENMTETLLVCVISPFNDMLKIFL